MNTWAKNKKIFDNSIKLLTKLITTFERETHTRSASKKDKYCKNMLKLWEILETCSKNQTYKAYLKNGLNDDLKFIEKLLDNLKNHA